jgi:hypothetical protein
MMGQTGKGLSFSFLLLGLLSAVGCSSTEDAPDPNATVSGFCGNWAKAACSAPVVQACAGVDKADPSLTDACVMSQRVFCENLLPTKGYSSQKATQCLNAVQEAYKDARLTALEIATVRHRGEPCNQLIKGPQGAGESCGSDDDCDTVRNYLCVMKGGEGTCQIPKLVANGDPCSEPASACNPGYYCATDAEACVKSKAVGKACAAEFECETGLVCEGDPKKCTEKVSPESCTEDADCTTNVCDIPYKATEGRCVSTIILSGSTSVCTDLQ